MTISTRRNYRNRYHEPLYRPAYINEVSAWRWAADLAGGVLVVVAIGACFFLAAILSINRTVDDQFEQQTTTTTTMTDSH
jgi:hypothetical protein